MQIKGFLKKHFPPYPGNVCVCVRGRWLRKQIFHFINRKPELCRLLQLGVWMKMDNKLGLINPSRGFLCCQLEKRSVLPCDPSLLLLFLRSLDAFIFLIYALLIPSSAHEAFNFIFIFLHVQKVKRRSGSQGPLGRE